MILASVGAVLGPFYDFVNNGKFATLYNLKLPYFNQEPSMEFVINIVWETLISSLGVIGLFELEVVIALINDTITVSSKLSELELSDFSKLIEGKLESKANRVLKLRMILMRASHIDKYYRLFQSKHSLYNRSSFPFSFIKAYKSIMYVRNFASPPLFTFSIAVSIYSQMMV